MKKKIIYFIEKYVLKKVLGYDLLFEHQKTIEKLNQKLLLAYDETKLQEQRAQKYINACNAANFTEFEWKIKKEAQKDLVRSLCALVNYEKATYSWQSKSRVIKASDSEQVKQINKQELSYLAYIQIHTLQDLLDEHFKQIKQ